VIGFLLLERDPRWVRGRMEMEREWDGRWEERERGGRRGE
jgi:hypothetical protein